MPVSRKNMKKSLKSSKRSKNVRTSKKTSKNMKKMRGGAGAGLTPGLNQTVDFIIYNNNNEVLVSKNSKVTGIENKTNNNTGKWALLGTFATSSILDGTGQHNQTKPINNGIKTNDFNKLVPLTPANALLLLKKILSNKSLKITNDINININNINYANVENKFYPITNDIRLKDCKNNDPPCTIYTQVFKIHVKDNSQWSFENENIKWIKYDSNEIFSDHKEILNDVFVKNNDKLNNISF